MGKRGPKPGFNAKRRISESWSPELAYAVGLLATDGCLSPPGHLIDLTSNDREQLENFNRCASSLRVLFSTISYYPSALLPQSQRHSAPSQYPTNIFSIFYGAFSMEMVVPIRIGIHGGNRVSCFIYASRLQVPYF